MIKYRIIHAPGSKIAAMLVCIAVTALTLHQYAKLIRHLLTIKYNWQFELLVVTGMLFFQYPFIYKNTWSLKLEYYFNMLLVSLMGAVLLFPVLALNQYSNYTDTFNLLYFFAVVLIMFFVHKRIVAKLGLPVLVSYTWVLYRIFILIFILT